MADRDIGRSDPLIARAGLIGKAGSATDGQKRHQRPKHESRREETPERRSDDPASRRWRRLLDLLFEEIEKVPGVRTEQRHRLRENLREHIVARARAEHVVEPTEEELRALLDVSENPDDHPDLIVDIDRVVEAAVPEVAPAAPPASEEAELAQQFRRCLEVNTETARKVSLYLTLLIRLSGALRPRFTLEA